MKLLRNFAVFGICAALLCGCTPDPDIDKGPEPTIDAKEALLTLEEYPRMDGSTANLPLMAEVLSRTTGITKEEAENLTSCTMTPQSWHNLAEGEADILLVYEAAEETKAALEQTGTELEITPIGNDALVFIVNENNPVESLTTKQIQDIYTGRITNWKEVGGEDLEIVPFQRGSTSGSQSLFMKLIMTEEDPMEAPTELSPGLMGELIDAIASYNNSANAIGYSVYYYASYMYTQPGLKFIKVDDVMPTDETIADESYPHINPYFVAIRAEEAEDSPARILRDWILSDEGKEAIVAAGYIPVN
ncbi:MAG: phosphate ABC transporter substrate-binding protein [Lachnospiraceae bacterium]|nr:phosphate ABC transporter substrate-binding protein [Lachnospiraceae bacterium]